MVKKAIAIDTIGLVKRTDYNAKNKDIEDKVPDNTNLATTAALTVVEDKIPNTGDLVKKADYDTKMSEIDKNILLLLIITKGILDAKLAEKI